MPFPDAERVIFSKNPLRRVICQVRYPSILTIDTHIPDLFQEKIRQDFPNYAENAEVRIEFPEGVELPVEVINQARQFATVRNYEFASEDNTWKINLTRSFFALTAVKYRRWEDFRERLQMTLDAFVTEYSPPYFSRIGLRYVNVIKRSELGLTDVPWNRLVQPYMCGVLSSPEVGSNIVDLEAKYEISLSDDRGKVRIITKLVDEDDEKCFSIDSDFFIMQKTHIEQAFDTLGYFNRQASRLIQWAITPQLYDAMEPDIL